MKRIIVYSVIIALLVFYLVFGHNGLIKYGEMVDIQRQYELQLREMEEKITYMQRELDLLKKDKNYLEYVIRRELGMQLPDEDQYILPNESVQSK